MIDRAGIRTGSGGRTPRPTAGLVRPRRFDRRGVLGLLAGAALGSVADFGEVAAANAKGKKIAREARKHNGDRYVAGGKAPGGFDCSGFTYYVVKKALRRDISPALQSQKNVGRRVSPGKRRKGDLIFFSLEGGRRVTHVAIVLNKNRVIHAMNPRDGVKISDINTPYYQDNIHSVRRL